MQACTPRLSVHGKLTDVSSRTIQGQITLLSMMTSRTLISGDPFVVNQLKTHFQRLRPSDILNTYAFPSGHTTAAVFIMGRHPSPAHSMHFQLAVKTVYSAFTHNTHVSIWIWATHHVVSLHRAPHSLA